MGRARSYARAALGRLTLPDDLHTDPCFALTEAERARLWQAACLLADQRGLLPKLSAWLGGQADRLVGLLGEGWRERVQALVEEALWRAQNLATLGLDAQQPARARPHTWLARAATTASGAATGLVGLPGVAIDIPFTTLTILRSIAEIARDEGEDITSEEGRRACLEVLALGGPGPREDEVEMGYWTARLGLAGLNMSAVVPQAARMLGSVVSEKIVAQAVPLAGAVAGAGLNYAFIRYYQQMARAHFAVRAIERAHGGRPYVGACLQQMVGQAKRRRDRVSEPGAVDPETGFATDSAARTISTNPLRPLGYRRYSPGN